MLNRIGTLNRDYRVLMPCPSIGPNYFGLSKLLWIGTNWFGRVQFVLEGSKLFWPGSN